MKPRVMFYEGDPGGKAAIMPVVKFLEREGIVSVSREDGDFVLAGTSAAYPSADKMGVYAARQMGIPSLSVLDFWSNYDLRFDDGSGEFAYLPDKVCVMDEQAQREAVNAGIPYNKIVITGQPAWDCLTDKRKGMTFQKRRFYRQHFGMPDDKPTAVFVSQPLSKMPYDYGYNERQVIPMVVSTCEMLGMRLIIRPHPREAITDLTCYTSPTVTVRRDDLVHELLMAADIVIGMNSELLVESCYLGCKVLSVQPGCILPDRLPTNRSGASLAVYRSTDLGWKMHDLLSAFSNKKSMQAHAPAAPRIAQLIYERLGV